MESFLIYIAKASALLGIFYFCYLFLLRKETTFRLNRRFLIGGVVISLALPLVYFTKIIYIAATPFAYNFTATPTEMVTSPVQNVTDWWQVTGIFYFIVSGFFILRLLLQLSAVLKIIFQNEVERSGRFKFLKVSEEQLPFSFFNYIVFNPALHSANDLELILEHEKVHARQLHSADILFINLVHCFFWFNPFSWFYKKSVEENLEFIADRETVNNTAEIKEYQHALVKVSIADLKPALTNHFYQSFIKKRILMLNKKSSNHSPAWKLSLVMPLLLAFMLLFNVKTEAQVVPPKEKNKNAEKVEAPEVLEDVDVEIDEIAEIEEVKEMEERIEIIAENIPDEVYYIKLDNEKRKDPYEILGNEPLYFINGKEYKASRLNNKYVAFNSRLEFLNTEDATKRFGSKGKNGAVIIPDGNVVKNFNKKLNEAQEMSTNFRGNYLTVDNNGKPIFMNIRSSKNNNHAIIQPYSTMRQRGSENMGIKRGNAVIFKNKSDYEVITGKTWKTSGSSAHIFNGNSAKWKVDPGVTVTGTYFSTDNTSDIMEVMGDGIIIAKSRTTQDDTIVPSRIVVQDSKPIYVVDDEIMGKEFIANSIKPEEIAAINVLKGDKATEKYGKKGKDGVIELHTKSSGYKATNKNPEVVVFGVNKDFSDSDLESLKESIMESTGTKVQFSGIQRNSSNQITKIEISVENGDQKASANWDDTDGIPKISIGFSEKKGIFIRTF